MYVIIMIQINKEGGIMKQYPYNDSTDMVIYTGPEPKKKKTPKNWLIAVTSAVLASVFTVTAMVGIEHFTTPSGGSGVIYSNRQNGQDNAAITLANTLSEWNVAPTTPGSRPIAGAIPLNR